MSSRSLHRTHPRTVWPTLRRHRRRRSRSAAPAPFTPTTEGLFRSTRNGGALCRLSTMTRSQRRPRLSEPALRVLRVMLEKPSEPVYGLVLMDRCDVRSGTLYPLLARLAEAGWLAAEREEVNPATAGRPARTYYRLTGEGEVGARAALAPLAAPVPGTTLGWAGS